MGKSLTELATGILMKEGVVPSVSSSDNDPDRDAKSTTVNKSSLRPNAGAKEGPFANPGSNPPDTSEVQDLGPALVKQGDVPPSAKAAAKMGKDKSKSSSSPVGSEPIKKLKEEKDKKKEDDDDDDDDDDDEDDDKDDDDKKCDENVEISEELEAFVAECIEKGMNEEQISQAIDENFEYVEEQPIVQQVEEDRAATMKEHVDALLEGEETLSEDFRMKAQTIFESAVGARVKQELTIIEEAYTKSLEEEIENVTSALVEQVDNYLNYIIEQWISDNEVAIESALRTEITEDFIAGFRNLCLEHSIEMPEERVNVVEELANEKEKIEAKLNEEIEKNVELTKVVNESKRFEVFVDACVGLTDTQAEKLKTLAESVEFKSAEEFEKKLATLKESYFQVSVNATNALDSVESADPSKVLTENLQGPMAAYVRTLGRSMPK